MKKARIKKSNPSKFSVTAFLLAFHLTSNHLSLNVRFQKWHVLVAMDRWWQVFLLSYAARPFSPSAGRKRSETERGERERETEFGHRSTAAADTRSSKTYSPLHTRHTFNRRSRWGSASVGKLWRSDREPFPRSVCHGAVVNSKPEVRVLLRKWFN